MPDKKNPARKKEPLPAWDLGDLYLSPTDPKIARDMEEAGKIALHSEQYLKGKLAALDGDKLAKAIARYERMEELLGRLHSYAYLRYAENMEDAERARFHQDIGEKTNEIATHILFFTLEINRIPDNALAKKLLASRDLARYKPWLRNIRAFKPYQLEENLETLLHEKSVTGAQAWVRLFDETLAGLRFPFDKATLTCTEIFHKMSSPKEEVRKQAAKSIGKVLKDNANTFAMITNVLAKDKAIEDKWRSFPQPISSRNVSNFIEDDVVDALISAVQDSYPRLSHRYYKIKAQWMGKKRLDYWDRNAPLPSANNRKIPWEEARDLVLDAYGNFAPRLRQLGQKFFDNAWIDVPPRPGKDSGAFAHPTVPSAHPYLLLNYQGKIHDVMTLAHELGHGVHQLLSYKQGALMDDTPLTLAETASVFGEQLAFREILAREKNTEKRRIIIAGKVEDMLNTVVRQVAFCEFERKVHDARKNGEIPAEKLNQFWMEVQAESLGSAIRFDKDYGHFWAYIPHFIHSPFYVYAYAFGDCLVNALYAEYMRSAGVSDSGGKKKSSDTGSDTGTFQNKYFTMLEAGGTLHHKELLAPFGLNAADPGFWKKGLGVIEGMIEELES